MKDRPKCVSCGKRDGWVLMYGQWVCGECVAEWNKKMNESNFENFKEVVNGS